MSRCLLKTRVTLGISFWPSCTSGFAACSLSLPAVYSASLRSTRWLLSTTELIGTRLSSLFRFGTTILDLLHAGLVGLEVDVHVALLAEDAGHARDQLLAFLHERVRCLLLVLAGGVQRLFEVDALAAQHDRADRHALVLFVQVRHHELGSSPRRAGRPGGRRTCRAAC